LSRQINEQKVQKKKRTGILPDVLMVEVSEHSVLCLKKNSEILVVIKNPILKILQ